MTARPARVLIMLASAGLLMSCLTTDPDTGIFRLGDHRDAALNCTLPVGWSVPGGETLDEGTFLDRIARGSAVLLGERHDELSHHRWQLDTLRALHQRRPDIILGLEMFPRRVQGVLDAWSRGELSEEAFLEHSDWAEVWRLDPELYMDIFRYARDQRIPMRALNVESSFTRSVSKSGFDATPVSQREGVTRPAEPSPKYAQWLGQIYDMHTPSRHRGGSAGAGEGLRFFIEAQLVWDRSMAQGIHQALTERPDALVVGLIGSGHLQHGYGVPRQLDDLGIGSHAILLPWDGNLSCAQLVAGLADAVYNVENPLPRPATPVS
ncbi:ChaN family lipoprotein [Rhodocyclaceae bacterium SMB388]